MLDAPANKAGGNFQGKRGHAKMHPGGVGGRGDVFLGINQGSVEVEEGGAEVHRSPFIRVNLLFQARHYAQGRPHSIKLINVGATARAREANQKLERETIFYLGSPRLKPRD